VHAARQERINRTPAMPLTSCVPADFATRGTNF
jgi:hypothetical protein